MNDRFYEPYEKRGSAWKRPKRSRRNFSPAASLIRLLFVLLLICALALGALYALPVSVFMIDRGNSALGVTAGLPQDSVNILVVGTDTENEGMTRADTVMIASIGYSGVRLTSVVRDAVFDIPGYGRKKINAAYAYGGEELLMRTLNESLKLNITKYIHADFVAAVKVVDSINGVDIDITQAEMEQINENVKMSGKVFRPLGYTAYELKNYGTATHLDGLQALGYARIRKIDSDFTRTSRQRELLRALRAKLRDRPYLLVPAVKAGMEQIDTNLTVPEMLSFGLKVLLGGEVRTLRLPEEGTYTDDGSSVAIVDLDANRRAFMRFVYGAEEGK